MYPENNNLPAMHDSRNLKVKVEGEFCPLGGMLSETTHDFDKQVRCTIQRRLRSACLILLGGSFAFLISNFLLGAFAYEGAYLYYVPEIILLIGLSLCCAFLLRKVAYTVNQLRVLEGLIFGLPALLFAWLPLVSTCPLHGGNLAHPDAFPGMTMIPWILLINIYGIFIPNSTKRAGVVIAVMAVLPIVSSLIAASMNADIANALMNGGWVSIILYMAIAAITAIYGTHRVRQLNLEAFEAHRLGNYKLREKLGSGGMGDVYLAEHHLLKRTCAIKLIQPGKAGDPNAIARFESEVQTTARLTHPNTIEIYDYGRTSDGTFYYAMEFLPGLNLQEMIDRFGPMPAERVVYLLRQVCSALAEAHSVGLIHRDIKPGNIFATERGRMYDVAKLLDFGLVKLLDTHNLTDNTNTGLKLTIDGAVVGSPLYAAPELTLENQSDARSDIYSLGATAYFLLTGKPVFDGDNAIKVIFAHANEAPQELSLINDRIPDELESIVMRCLAKNSDDRYQSVLELEQALVDVPLDNPWNQQLALQWWAHSDEHAAKVNSSSISTIDMGATRVMSPAEVAK